MKSKLVESQTIRQKSIENGDQKVVGVNCFSEGERSPLVQENDGGFMKVDEKSENKQITNVKRWKEERDNKKSSESSKRIKTKSYR